MCIRGRDKITYILGIAILGFVAWQLIGYILPDQKGFKDGATFLSAVVKKSGGEDRWESIKNLRFDKDFKLYASDGSIEIARDEHHDYQYENNHKKMITWQKDSLDIMLLQQDTMYHKYINTLLDSTATATGVKASIDAGAFVIGIPFSLIDGNATLTYLGLTTFQDKEVHNLNVTFAGSTDIWYFYYDTTTLDWLGYWVKTSDHYSLIVNEEFVEVEGFTLPRKRKSYRTDASQKVLYLSLIHI